MFLALGLILPFFTGQIPLIGSMLLPMHIPVIFCGLICGWKYGLLIGLITPLLRSAIFSMPPMFPTALAMAFELGAYGALAGWLYQTSRWKCLWALYKALVGAMIGGRLIFGIVMKILMSAAENPYTFSMFIQAALVTSVPGIILQLILIPAAMLALHKTGLVPCPNAQKVGMKHV